MPAEPGSAVQADMSNETNERDAPVDTYASRGPGDRDGSEIRRGSDGPDEEGEPSDLDADNVTNGSREPSNDGQEPSSPAGERSEIGDA